MDFINEEISKSLVIVQALKNEGKLSASRLLGRKIIDTLLSDDSSYIFPLIYDTEALFKKTDFSEVRQLLNIIYIIKACQSVYTRLRQMTAGLPLGQWFKAEPMSSELHAFFTFLSARKSSIDMETDQKILANFLKKLSNNPTCYVGESIKKLNLDDALKRISSKFIKVNGGGLA